MATQDFWDMTKPMMVIVGSPAQLRDQFVVYRVNIQEFHPNAGFIGVCKLTEVFTHRDAYLNSEWSKYVKDHTVVETIILSICDTLSEAHVALARWYREMRPHCNVKGHRVGNLRGAVTCIETGESWASQALAARANGISPGAMSNHLNGRPNYEKIHGKTFRRGY